MKKKVSGKKSSLEDLIQKYLNASHAAEKKILLGLIRLQRPDYKG